MAAKAINTIETTFVRMYTLKKSLGQHFLQDENILKRIMGELEKEPFQNLLEVGPGGGALTSHLLKLKGINFLAVEVDDEKVTYLEKTYPSLKGRIIHKDFLEMKEPFGDPFYVVGNFPYNISTQIVFRMIEWRQQVQGMIGMFQKEVAQRIAAPEGSKVYGVTSVLTQAFFDVTYLFDVPPEAFRPPPKVMSGVIRLSPRVEPLVMYSEKRFFTLVKAAFGQRRKTLRNAVRALFTDDVLRSEIFNKRAEQLNVPDFASLTFQMK
jgi:16S rRNA (adenine1518-N6/adenine1519-N6)-dimethyltransferase